MSEQKIDDLKRTLADLLRSEPKKPRPIQLIFEDVTQESLAYELYHGAGNAALVSDEGATILGARASQYLSILNKLYSGDSVTVNRRRSESFVVSNARVTLSLMVQPNSILKFYQKKGAEASGIGFLARFLVCNPVSTQGGRYIW